MNDRQQTPDERIAAAARDLYNAPPEPPREEMWAEIEARLQPGTSAAAEEGGRIDGGTVLPLQSRVAAGASHRPTRRLAWWIGIAAALVIGLGLGRLTMRSGPADVQVASDRASETMAETPAGEPAPIGPEDAEAESTDRAADEAPGRPDAADRLASGDMAAPAPTAGRQAPGQASASSGRAPGLQYAATTRRLLDRGESFLATVQADLASGAPDPEMETWARSLLSRTRVLMSSPAARDPETRRLLQDLELMLAQIVVTTATGDPGEARILGEGLEDGNLLYRLRSAMEEDEGPGGFRAPRTSSL